MLGESKEYKHSLYVQLILLLTGITILPLSIAAYEENNITETLLGVTFAVFNILLFLYLIFTPMMITSDNVIKISRPFRKALVIDIFDIQAIEKKSSNNILIIYKNHNNDTKKERISLFGMRVADQIYFNYYIDDIIKIINSRTAKRSKPLPLLSTV
jgi:hypothetical protein